MTQRNGIHRAGRAVTRIGAASTAAMSSSKTGGLQNRPLLETAAKAQTAPKWVNKGIKTQPYTAFYVKNLCRLWFYR